MDGIQYSSCETTEFISHNHYSSLLSPIEVSLEDDCLENVYVDSFASCILNAKYEQVNIHNVAFNQHHLSIYQQQDLFNIISKHKKYSLALLESNLIRRVTLTSNLELSQCITALTPFLTYIDKLSKKNSITWSTLASLNHLGPLNECSLPLLFPKRMVGFGKSLIHAHLTMQLYTKIPLTYHHRHIESYL